MSDPYTLTTDRSAEPELAPQPDFPWRPGSQIVRTGRVRGCHRRAGECWALGTKHFTRLPQRWLKPVAKPGTGPSEAMRERGHYTVETYTTMTSGACYIGTFAQQCDAYNASGVLLGESGLALALDRDRLTDLRGVLTPAAAMGDALLARLPVAGVSMGTIRLN